MGASLFGDPNTIVRPNVLNTIASLRAINSLTNTSAQVLGYYAAGDNGGGNYYLDATDTTSVDNGGTIIVAADGGRWKLSYIFGISIKQFGAKLDGVTNDAVAVQNAITWGRLQSGVKTRVYWNSGTAKLNATIVLGSNQWIVFEQGATCDFSSLGVMDPGISAAGQTGICIFGNFAVMNGARANFVLSNGGLNTGIYLYGCSDVFIDNLFINNFGFDGINLTGDASITKPCTNVRIYGVEVFNCARNGMSITYADNVTVQGGRYRGTNGVPSGPWAGIDVEPNVNQSASNINIIGVATQDNAGAGLLFSVGGQSAAAGTITTVCVRGGSSNGDGTNGSSGTLGVGALMFANGGAPTNEVYGQIDVEGFSIKSPKAMGVSFQNWDALLCPKVFIDKVPVINPNGFGGSTSAENQVGFLIYNPATSSIASMGKIRIRNCTATDTRTIPVMTAGMYLISGAGKNLQNVVVENFVAKNFLATAKYPVNTGAAGTSTFINVRVIYDNPEPISIAASVNDPGWGGQRLSFSTSGNSFTLPLAASCIGLYYEIMTGGVVVGNNSVVRSGSDQIKLPATALATSITVAPADCYRFSASAAGVWTAVPVV